MAHKCMLPWQTQKIVPLYAGNTVDHKDLGFVRLKDFLSSLCPRNVTEDRAGTHGMREGKWQKDLTGNGIQQGQSGYNQCWTISLSWKEENNDFLISLSDPSSVKIRAHTNRTISPVEIDFATNGSESQASERLGAPRDRFLPSLEGLRGGCSREGAVSESEGVPEASLAISSSSSSYLPFPPAYPPSIDKDYDSVARTGIYEGGDELSQVDDAGNCNRRAKVNERWTNQETHKTGDRSNSVQMNSEVEGPAMAEPEIVPESSFNVQDEQRWGAREVEKVEDVSCPEEKDGSIRVIQEPPQAQTRMPRQELVDHQKYNFVDPECKRRVLQMKPGVYRDLAEVMHLDYNLSRAWMCEFETRVYACLYNMYVYEQVEE
jgi:hypothetical protein